MGIKIMVIFLGLKIHFHLDFFLIIYDSVNSSNFIKPN
jgi:hypothetical protein